MKVGDEVTVYEDPLFETKEEGKAKLIKLLMDGLELQYWRVKFLEEADGVQFNRWLKKR